MTLVWKIVAGLLLAWAAFLYFNDPVLTLRADGDDTVAVECHSLADYGFARGGYIETRGTVITYDVVEGEQPEGGEQQPPYAITQQLNDHCNRALTARAGGIGLLAAVIGIVAVLGLGRRRTARAAPRLSDPANWKPRVPQPQRSEDRDADV
ncbi:MAG: hypothetical protein ACRDT6_01220 [Micromonosporaceae bacterium]